MDRRSLTTRLAATIAIFGGAAACASPAQRSTVNTAPVPAEQPVPATIGPSATATTGEPATTTTTTTAATSTPAPPPTIPLFDVTTTQPAPDQTAEYEAITMVLQSADHGPELCLGGAKASRPPICGGIPVNGWNWASVPSAQTVNDVTWVDSILVTGTYVGGTFTLTEPPRAPTNDDRLRLLRPPPAIGTPCPAPPGGQCDAGTGRSAGELQAIADDISAKAQAGTFGPGLLIGRDVYGVNVSLADLTVVVETALANQQLGFFFDSMYGVGVVTLRGGLQPVVPRQDQLLIGLALGDSVLAGAKAPLTQFGVTVDAHAGRRGIDALRTLQIATSEYSLVRGVVIHLGTDDALSTDEFDAMLDLMPEVSRIVVLTVHGPMPWVAATNDIIRGLPARYPNVEVVDWDRAATEHPEWLAPDGTTLGSEAGIAGYTDLVSKALSAPYDSPVDNGTEPSTTAGQG